LLFIVVISVYMIETNVTVNE